MRKDNIIYINDKDIWIEWSAILIEGSYNSLMEPADLKSYVENDFRSQHGKRVSVKNTRYKDRNITLVFDIQGTSMRDYNSKKDSLLAEMQKGIFELKVIPLMTVYKVFLPPGYFLGLSSDPGLSSGKFSVRLNEPNPTDRKTENILPWLFKDDKWREGYWVEGGRWGIDLDE